MSEQSVAETKFILHKRNCSNNHSHSHNNMLWIKIWQITTLFKNNNYILHRQWNSNTGIKMHLPLDILTRINKYKVMRINCIIITAETVPHFKVTTTCPKIMSKVVSQINSSSSRKNRVSKTKTFLTICQD